MKKNVVCIVEIDDCYDYENKLTVEVFSTYRKALEFYCKCLNDFYEMRMNYDTVENNEEGFLAYDEGWFERDHYSIRLYEKEVR